MELTIYDRFKVRTVKFFNEFELSLNYDSFGSTFSFKYYFDPTNPDHKELSCVSHDHECVVTHNKQILITGFAMTQEYELEPTKKLAVISGYSKPGLFTECQIPPDLYPLQSDGVSIATIAKKITDRWKKWKIGVVVDTEVSDLANKPFKSVTASETENIDSFLLNLAQQKSLVISHDEKGNLLITKAKTKQKPFMEFDSRVPNMIPLTGSKMTYNGSAMHSHITVLKQASSDGGNAGEYTLRNPYCPIVYRPKVVSQTSGDDIDSKEAAIRELGKELDEGLKFTIKTDRWLDSKGNIIRPNSIISIFAPEMYIYTKATLFVRSIDFSGNNEQTIATLNCVIPEAFSREIPTSIFAGINMHP
jgi:prophage tail gpP-like protein